MSTSSNLSFHINDINSGSIEWNSPSNIAFIKYWGKKEVQLPLNPSLSMTLKKSLTQTQLCFELLSEKNSEDEFYFAGELKSGFSNKTLNLINLFKNDYPQLTKYKITIKSDNTFPHSTGIASSASSMSALSLCLYSLVKLLKGESLELTPADYKTVSSYARLGSGSASRSIYSGYACWGRSKFDTCDEYATSLADISSIHDCYQELCDSVLIVSEDEKAVSSSVGHGLMNTNPYRQTRITCANNNFDNLIKIMQGDDFDQFGQILEKEALDLHALMMQSTPSFILMKPATIEVIQRVREFRKTTGVAVYFTLDAGPNVHLIYQNNVSDQVKSFINDQLLEFSPNRQCIHDEIGTGANLVKVSINGNSVYEL